MSRKEELLFVREASGLVRTIGPYSGIFVNIMGGGIRPFFFAVPALLIMVPGFDLTLMLSVAAIFTLLDVTSTAILSSSMPRSGGPYIHISRSLGPMWGTMEAWRAFITNPLANAIQSYMASATIGALISQIGFLLENPSLVTTGKSIAASPIATVGLTALFILLTFASDFFGPRQMSRWYVVGGILTIIGILLMWVSLAGVTPANLPQSWDARWGTGAYDEIVNVATEGGYKSVPASWEKMVIALGTPFALMGPYNLAVVGGEVERPKRTIPAVMITGAFILIIFYVGTTALISRSFGDFVKMYGFVAMRPQLAGKLTKNVAIPPNYAFYTASITANPAIAVYISATTFFSLIATFPQPGIWTSRNLFALAFDRMLPSIFTKVNRWHAPTYCCVLYLILSAVFCLMMVPWYAIMTMSLFLTFLTARSMWAWSSMAFPFVRPHLHEVGLAWKIGGVPVVAITGLIVSAFGWLQLFGGVTPVLIWPWLIIYSSGMLGYVVASQINARRGMDVSRIFGQLPPD